MFLKFRGYLFHKFSMNAIVFQKFYEVLFVSSFISSFCPNVGAKRFSIRGFVFMREISFIRLKNLQHENQQMLQIRAALPRPQAYGVPRRARQ